MTFIEVDGIHLNKESICMGRSRSLCFTKRGLYNTKDIEYIENNHRLTTIVLAGDGSLEALEHIRAFQDHPVLKSPHIGRVFIAKTPSWEVRVRLPGGEVSAPHYLYSEEDTIKWICAKVAAPHLEIMISDITSKSSTTTMLDRDDVEAVCYHSYQFWEVLKVAEDRLTFPAAVIDKLTPLTYNLSPETIDIVTLRKETGITSLDYNPTHGVLSVEVGGEIFTVKLQVINDFYGDIILPQARKLLVRRLKLMVSVINQGIESTQMSYGQIGHIISHMRDSVIQKVITPTSPIPEEDILPWATRLRIDEESCVWVNRDETISETIDRNRSSLVLEPITEDGDDSENT